MTYCLGIVTKHGLVMASDSRTNAGTDQASICRKMFTFEVPGERALVLLTSGSLSLSQSVISLLQNSSFTILIAMLPSSFMSSLGKLIAFSKMAVVGFFC